METRQNNNIKILAKLAKFIMNNPDIRFCQALYCLNILKENEDVFNEEPDKTLERMSV